VNRASIILVLVIFMTSFAGAQLNVLMDQNRFFDDKLNTIFEINYQIPYKDLYFTASEYGFMAELDVDFVIEKNGVQVYDQSFTNNIILTTGDMTLSDEIYRDKISLTLSKPGFTYNVMFKDINAEKSVSWRKEMVLLEQDEMLSDLELAERVIRDTTTYLGKFHRGDLLFYQKPDHIFQKTAAKLYVYFEIQNFQFDDAGNYHLKEEIQVLDQDSLIYRYDEILTGEEESISRINEIDYSQFDPGYYQFQILIEDLIGKRSQHKQDYFSIRKEKQPAVRIFTELKDEYNLMKYFLSSSQLRDWEKLTDEGKNNFLIRFWNANDPNPTTAKNEFLAEIKNRIEYCNYNFTHFKDGWNTDRGRIYIRQGKPDEVRKLQTGLNTRLGTKDIEIWKYNLQKRLTYLFLDLQTSGNFKLIYTDYDEREASNPDWQDYLGEDFDYDLLE